MSMEFVQTGVFATPEEVDEIKSCNHVWVLIPPIQQEESIHQATHRIAMMHGLPDVLGFYGIDTETREFLKAGGIPPNNEEQEGRTG